MATAFVIRNQLGQYLTRKNEWVSGKDASILFNQPHYDQALNQLIEVNAKDIDLRGVVLELELDDKRRPVVVEFGPEPVQAEPLQPEAIESESELESESQGANDERAA